MKRRFALLFGIIALALLAGRTLLSVQSVARVAPKPQPIATPAPKIVALPTAKPAPLPSYESYLPIVATADGFAPVMNLPKPDPNSHWKNPAKPVEPAFPKNFDAPVRVRSGVADVQATPLNANPGSRGEIGADGSLIYRNAFEGCDVQYRCTALKTEEFIVINSAASNVTAPSVVPEGPGNLAGGRAEGPSPRIASPDTVQRPARAPEESPIASDISSAHSGRNTFKGPSTGGGAFQAGPRLSSADPSGREGADANKSEMQWSWKLDTHGLIARLTPAHTIELCDNAGVPRLRINAPEGKDAHGKLLRVGERLALALDTVGGTRVTLTANLTGCAFPVTIDPSWSSTGSLAVSRTSNGRFPAILLTDGTVLIAGGNSTNDAEVYDPISGRGRQFRQCLHVGRTTQVACCQMDGF